MNQNEENNLGEIFGTLVSTMNEMQSALDNLSHSGVLYPQSLENCTEAVQSAPEGGNPMAYKRERVYLGLDDNGKPLHSWIDGKTEDERDIKKFLAILQSGRAWQIPEFREFIMTGAFNQPQEPQKPKTEIASFAWEWFNRYKKGKIANTYEYQLKQRIKSILKCCPVEYVEDVTTDTIQDILNKRVEISRTGELSTKTVSDIKRTAHELFSYAESLKLIEFGAIAWSRIKNPGMKCKTRKSITVKEYNNLVSHIPELYEPMEQLAVAILAFTGVRPEELLGLKWEDIDFENKVIYIRRAVVYPGNMNTFEIKAPKNENSKAPIPLAKNLLPYLVKHRRVDGWIIHGKDGQPFKTRYWWEKVWEGAASHIELYGLRPCEFRKVVPSVLLATKNDPKAVSRLLRHANVDMTLNTYAEPDMEAVIEASNSLGEKTKIL